MYVYVVYGCVNVACICMWVGVDAQVYLCIWRPEVDVRCLLLSPFIALSIRAGQ